MHLDSKGVLLYSQDSKNNIMSRLNVQADRISMVVEGEGKNAKIRRGQIVLAINEGRSSARIQADEIVLEGYTLLQRFSGLDGTVTRLMAGTARASKLWASTIDGGTINAQGLYADYFSLDRHSVYAGAIIVNGQSYNVLRWS